MASVKKANEEKKKKESVKKAENKSSAIKSANPQDWDVEAREMDTEGIREDFLYKIKYYQIKDAKSYTSNDAFVGLSLAMRDRLVERWIETQKRYTSENTRRVYYLSLEFLMGRLLGNNVSNLGVTDNTQNALKELGLSFEEIEDQEIDAGLGNGGLGRLAACFLDSMATMELPSVGYGIRYEFGIFLQKILNGYQIEIPEQWLANGNPWEIKRPEYQYKIHFYGRVENQVDERGKWHRHWVNTDDAVAVAYDIPIPGYRNNTVNTLRLWSSKAENDFHLGSFNSGDYVGACSEKLNSENISKVLYPNDNNHSGKELRLKQQFFFTSASLQDIIRRHFKSNDSLKNFADKNVIQLNDTHPAIAVVELMRLFLDKHNIEWEEAWSIVSKTFAYTNHTLMPEALERWSVGLLANLLPRHIEIIYEINSRFLREVSYKFPGDTERLRRMSIIEEGDEQKVRMAYLAIVASFSVNGVAALHSDLLKNGLLHDFYQLYPEKFNNKTNGVTPRRWIHQANRPLSDFISSKIGKGWITDLSKIKQLEKFADDVAFQKEWMGIKKSAKERLAVQLEKWYGIKLDTSMLYDVQIKRIHEYKRQLLNALHVVYLYAEIKSGHTKNFTPRTVMFGGKAAPGYYMAKLIIKFINNISEVINNDPATKGLLRAYFVPNYRVSLAQYLIPATDLSEQISTAGTEASGTGNMKFAMNGALTIGTMDGANVEMAEEIGEKNMFIFGLRTNEVEDVQRSGYNSYSYYERSETIRKTIDFIRCGYFSPVEDGIFNPLIDSLLYNDRYLILADFDDYVRAQKEVSDLYINDKKEWARRSIINVANTGKFSSDRTIAEYANEIWNLKPVKIKL
ncbi:MAG: glycogen/starch/alpha-glucan phosphorylase [Chitinispirillales bacterium]|nr:glycogen/starch/alpha-glucan phosphorylase [Chitinispirillales bacterium]